MPITKRNGMQIATVEYDTPEAELCSIRSTNSFSGCSSCASSCHACGKSHTEGLLAVQGNIIEALNVSGAPLWIGSRVAVYISEKAIRFQGWCAIGIPIFFSILAFTLIFLLTKSEAIALTGMAAGLVFGGALACGIRSVLKERALPRIVSISVQH